MYSSLVNMLNLTSSNECTCIQAYMWACSFVPMAGARACHAHVWKNEREEGRMKKKKWCHKHRMWKPFPVRFFFQPHIFVEASPLFLITGRPHSHGKNTGTAPPCILSLSLSLKCRIYLLLFVCFLERYHDVFSSPVFSGCVAAWVGS